MCGSYIHGRSWFDDEVWHHICDPMKINSHNEMTIPSEKLKETEIGVSVSIDYMYTGQTDLHLDIHNVDLKRLKRPEIDPNNMHTAKAIVLMGSHLDWGIQPWDGEAKLQSRQDNLVDEKMFWDNLTRELKAQDFLPKTRADLIGWTKAHWGKLNDMDEFVHKMPQCLNYEKIRSKLPVGMRRADVNWKGDALLFIGGRNVGVVKNFELGFNNQNDRMSYAISKSSNPCNRFCEMFAEAPNAFWAERN